MRGDVSQSETERLLLKFILKFYFNLVPNTSLFITCFLLCVTCYRLRVLYFVLTALYFSLRISDFCFLLSVVCYVFPTFHYFTPLETGNVLVCFLGISYQDLILNIFLEQMHHVYLYTLHNILT